MAAAGSTTPSNEGALPRWRPVIFVVAFSSGCSILSGYDQGVIAGAIIFMERDLQLSKVQTEICVGCVNAAAALGAVLGGRFSHYHGRRWAISAANALFILGVGLTCLSTGFCVLMAGRLVTGIAVGWGLVVGPLFCSELVPASLRGKLVSMGDVACNLGITLGYVAGLVFYKLPDFWAWRGMLAVGLLPPVLLLFVAPALPESPRWLASQRREADAREALGRLLWPGQVDEELRAITEQVMGDEAAAKVPWREVLCPRHAPVRRMMLAGLGVAFFSQATGTEAAVYYVPHMLKEAGLESVVQQLLGTVLVGVVKLIVLLWASSRFDVWGRRPMLLASGTCLLCSLLLLALGFQLQVNWLSLAALCLFMGSFSLGFSPLVYVIGTEVFPHWLRAKAMGVALLITRLVAGVVSSSFMTLQDLMTVPGSYLLFAAIALWSVLFVHRCVPETVGLSLEEVQTRFYDPSDAAARGCRGHGRVLERVSLSQTPEIVGISAEEVHSPIRGRGGASARELEGQARRAAPAAQAPGAELQS